MLRACARVALASVALLCAEGARAQDRCGPAGRPWVSVAWSGAWEPELQRAVLEDLRAGLRQKGIAACPLGSGGSEPPIALLALGATSDARVSVAIEVHDALTEKRVLRDLDLSALSADARALAIAAAADELLRASWAELALEDAPKPTREPPPEVQRTVRQALSPARVGRRDVAFGARGAFEHHGGGHTQLGADAVVTVWLGERVGLDLALGLREGLVRDSDHGRIESRALCGGGDLLLALLPRDPVLGLAVTLGAALASLHVQGAANPDALGDEDSGLSAHARAGLLLTLAPLPALGVRASVAVGGPLRSVKASDDERVVTSTAGVQLQATLGTELRF